MMCEEFLADLWNAVEHDFLDHRINSERGMQAVMYRSLRDQMQNHLVLVEPAMNIEIDGHQRLVRPDIVVCDDYRPAQDTLEEPIEIKCVMELKCKSDFWLTPAQLDSDLAKLQGYSVIENAFPLYVYGLDAIHLPNGAIHPNSPRPQFIVTEQTCYVFAMLAREGDPAANWIHVQNRFHAIGTQQIPPNFYFLRGVMEHVGPPGHIVFDILH